jgi:hypothetical protein
MTKHPPRDPEEQDGEKPDFLQAVSQKECQEKHGIRFFGYL